MVSKGDILNNTDNYIATSPLFPEWLINFSEILTILTSIWVLYEVAKLVFMYAHHKKGGVFAKILTWTFLAKAFTSIVIMMMGLFLYLNWTNGVKFLVVFRPFIELFGGFWLRRLRKYHERND